MNDIDQLSRLLEQVSRLFSDKEDDRPRSKQNHPNRSVPRRFLMNRDVDLSGISSTGYIASGVEFPDRTVVVRWYGNDPSTSVWSSIEALKKVHGHSGNTRIEWIDD